MSPSIPRLADSALAARALARAKIAYTDIDGTLLGRGGCLLCDLEGKPTLEGAQAVVSVNRAGLDVAIASGRTVPMLKEIARMLGWQDFIAEMGCMRGYQRGAEILYDLGEWDPSDVPADSTPHDVIEDAGTIRALLETFPGKIEYHTPHHLGREVTPLLRGHVDGPRAQAVLDEFALPLTFLDNGIIHPPAHTLDDVDTVHAYHIMPTGTSKARAILADLERRGLTPADAVMIGDSLADLDTHEAVALVVLVANALESPAVLDRAASVENLVVTEGTAGRGWAEFAAAWLAARA